MGWIALISYVGISQQRNGNVQNIIRLLYGCTTLIIQKTPVCYNRGIRATIERKERGFRNKVNGFVRIYKQISHRLPFLSVGERLFIINTKVICGRYWNNCAVIKERRYWKDIWCWIMCICWLVCRRRSVYHHLWDIWKEKVSRDRYANLKYKFRERHFWSEGRVLCERSRIK